ncbi:recombination regulator RecX [Pseudoxanthomonas winnipegensis]|jgi:regulatory protein|uniref:Regulatory protein RecX n=1 Tax=Pseudoxanthomonas winnipegensis TaxID=2480810 RepID=A0A4Q8L4Y5_9GAMM|nr:recombination regulator RecX [Pseudoxanthomonas winnipegensis]TAA20415.1 recombination regulator RecX [Pseudoxanthomonas winnipegensis]
MDERDAPDVSDAAAAEQGHKPRRRRPEPTPVQRALSLLVRREHSRKELTRKLAARGVQADEARAAVERLAGEGWQDDARFAESLVRTRVATGYGPRYIRVELETHGLDAAQVDKALASFEGDWRELARDLVARRFGPERLEDLSVQRKAADLLLRRGFDGEAVRAVLRGLPED